MLVRGANTVQKNSPNKDTKDLPQNTLKKKTNASNNSQSEDFDFWSMPQN
jgi:hypothetical protein